MLYCCYVVKMKQYFDEIRMIFICNSIHHRYWSSDEVSYWIYVCKDYILEIRQNQL